MIAKDLITSSVPPLKNTDSVAAALTYMKEFKVAHLPIVDGNTFIGVVTEGDLLDSNEVEKTLSELNLSLAKSFVLETQHYYEVIKLVSEQGVSLIPVITEKKNYVGVITLKSLISYLSELNSIKDPGVIITLEMGVHDYHLSEIARIAESNDTLILSLNVNTIPDSSRISVTLKLNSSNVRPLIASFERFSYRVTNSFLAEEYLDAFKERYDALMKYLDL